MINVTKDALLPLQHDDRDIVLGGVFNLGSIADVPKEDFSVNVFDYTLDQQFTDFCSAYAGTYISSDQEGVPLSPEYQFAITKQIQGSLESWGADLRSACKSFLKGSIPQSDWDDFFGKESRYDRNIVVDQKKHPKEWTNIARRYAKGSFWAITGNEAKDMFDSIILALWVNKDEKGGAITGLEWKAPWLTEKGGIIKTIYPEKGFGHAINLVGVKYIDGTPFIKARLSSGPNVGDKGFFYLSRDVINKYCPIYGVFMFKDLPKEAAKFLNNNNIKLTYWSGILAKLVAILKNII